MKILKKLGDCFRWMKPTKTHIQLIIEDYENNPNSNWRVDYEESHHSQFIHRFKIYKKINERRDFAITSSDFLGDISWCWYCDAPTEYLINIGMRDAYRLMRFARKHIKQTRASLLSEAKQNLISFIKE